MSESDTLQYVRGVPVPKVPWFTVKNIEDAMNYVPRDSDTIIGSYPKTGTSWLQYIVQQIFSKGESLPNFTDLYFKVIPFVEMAGTDAIDSLPEPRVYKYHLAYSAVQKNHRARYMYIYRNPEDVLISYYHFHRSIVGQELDIDEYLDDFLEGRVWFGNYCDHVQSYLSLADSGRMLMISYENLSADRKKEILRIAKFLGEEYYQELVDNEEILDRIVEHTGFEYMKKNTAMMMPEMGDKEESSEEREVNYFRKGVVGDGKKSLTDVQINRLREHVADKVKGTFLEKEWIRN